MVNEHVLPPIAERVLARAPRPAAFGVLARAIDALPEESAQKAIAIAKGRLHAWPSAARVLTVSGSCERPGVAALALARELVWIGSQDASELAVVLEQIPDLESVTLLAQDGAIPAAALELLPRGLRRLRISAHGARAGLLKRAEVAMSRFDRLVALDVDVGPSTPAFVETVLGERSLTELGVALDHFATLDALASLEGGALRRLSLGFTSSSVRVDRSALMQFLTKLTELRDLRTPVVTPDVLHAMPALERLFVIEAVGHDELGFAKVSGIVGALPRTLRALTLDTPHLAPLLSALGRAPGLEEMTFASVRMDEHAAATIVESGTMNRLAIARFGQLALDATRLFARAAPERLRELFLDGVVSREAVRAIVRADAWLVALESIRAPFVFADLRMMLASALAAKAPALVEARLGATEVEASKAGPIEALLLRGVAIDVTVVPARATRQSKAPCAQSEPAQSGARDIGELWSRIEEALAAQELSATGIGLRNPAGASLLNEALTSGLPASLCSMYAAHDGSRGPIECLGLERADGEPPRFEKVLWSSLAHIVASGPYQDDGRTAWVFACRWNDELAEEFDASGEPICPGADEDEFFAVDALTEEVLFFHPKAGWSIEAPHLRDTLQRVVRALAAEATFDEAGWLVKRKPTPEVARERPAELSESVVVELARALVDRHVVELREGTRVEGFAAALDAALASKTKEAKAQGVRDVFDGSLVDEVFADDDELDELVKSIVNRLG